MSKKTVSTYKARILERMNLPNDVALVRYALSHGLA
ncbi:LuxR C-terminal-related transcriptional regulator [Escherichia coli]